ncbi:MAG: type II secretion system protein [Gammaproteobacteria bacterium]|nr:type II secretion system protein [Gammaproteobacteria bacterium]
MKRQNGFTLIELVVVIVILGILAVTAAPKFIDLESDARGSAVEGVAGAAASAASINFASCAANSHTQGNCNAAGCITVSTCALIEGLVPDVNWGTDYDITATTSGTEPSANGTTASCTVTDNVDTSATATFQGIGACI